MNRYSDKLVDEHGEYYIGYANNTGTEFYIDVEDYEKIKDYNWYETHSGSTAMIETNNGAIGITMHKLLGFSYYDHKDRNELNNRKYNLRQCSHQQNCCNRGIRSDNTTGFTGVYQKKNTGKWFAQLYANGKNHYGLSRDTFEEAKIDRLKLEAKYMKEFSPNIDLFEQYGIKISYDNQPDNLIRQDNTSGCMGVSYDKSRNKWHVMIYKNKKPKNLGRFDDVVDAIKVRLNAEVEIYGYENAPQRHLFEQYGITQQNDLTKEQQKEDDEI